jgi:carbonic anhydrase
MRVVPEGSGARLGLFVLAVLMLASAQPSTAAESCSDTCEWGYGPETGPPRWGEICCPVCDGHGQSPVDLRPAKAKPTDLGRLSPSYSESHLEFFNNGHTIEAADELEANDNFLEVGERRYDLTGFHFHSLSEHTIDTRHSPLEMHLVHRRASYDLAVIAVMIEEGEPNEEFAPMWNALPADEAIERRTVILNPKKLLPDSLEYFTYSGSLTTPNCSEVVTWFVLAQPIQMSLEQIEAFRAVFDGNYRPVQPLSGRTVSRGGR